MKVLLKEEHGGAGKGILENYLVQKEFSAVDLGTDISVLLHNGDAQYHNLAACML